VIFCRFGERPWHLFKYLLYYYVYIIIRRKYEYRTAVGNDWLGRSHRRRRRRRRWRWRCRPLLWISGVLVLFVVCVVVVGVRRGGVGGGVRGVAGGPVHGHRRPGTDASIVTAGPRSGRVGHRQQRRAGQQQQRAGHGGTRAVHEAATRKHTRRETDVMARVPRLLQRDKRQRWTYAGRKCARMRRQRRRRCGIVKRARRHVQSVRRSAPMWKIKIAGARSTRKTVCVRAPTQSIYIYLSYISSH